MPDVMIDPMTLVKKNDALSHLMRAKVANYEGQTVNACPFGCREENLDETGYCRHLVGFTLPGNEAMLETMVPVNPPGDDDDYGDAPPPRKVDGKKVQKVRPSDKLVRITTCCRVYRESPDEVEPKPAPKKTA